MFAYKVLLLLLLLPVHVALPLLECEDLNLLALH
jgi:hypothetical protein